MKEILEAVMAKLKTQVSDLQYIAEDYGQIDNYGDVPPVKFPCALLSIGHVQYEEATKSQRRVKITLLVRIADAPSLIGNVAAPDSYRTRAFAIFDLIEKVKTAINGMQSQSYNKIKIQNATHFVREDLIREYAMTFQTGYLEDDF